ncbi:hypothetical protein MK280_02880, partial [Myxococcota bacterium]|nr:hypothetical protein [Myxococcota bacterium]
NAAQVPAALFFGDDALFSLDLCVLMHGAYPVSPIPGASAVEISPGGSGNSRVDLFMIPLQGGSWRVWRTSRARLHPALERSRTAPLAEAWRRVRLAKAVAKTLLDGSILDGRTCFR